MYSSADIPCGQLSLVNGLDAKVHLAMGQTLAQLAEDGTVTVGSSFGTIAK